MGWGGQALISKFVQLGYPPARLSGLSPGDPPQCSVSIRWIFEGIDYICFHKTKDMHPSSIEPLVHPDETQFMYYKQGTAGSFRTALYDLFWKADIQNQAKLISAFPELWVLRAFSIDEGYWQDLQRRWRESLSIE